MRIAYIEVAQRVYTFGGSSVFAHGLWDCCKSMDVTLDIFTDRPIASHKKKLPKEIYEDLTSCDRSRSFDVRALASRRLSPPSLAFALSVNTFLESLKDRVYDLVIFGGHNLAFLAYTSGFLHPRSYIYLHAYDFLSEYKQCGFPRWYVNIMRTLPDLLPLSGVLTSSEFNVKIACDNLKVPEDYVHVVPMVHAGYSPNYAGERSGIVFLGSGDANKNPEMFVAILNKLNEQAYFYIGRGRRRLTRILNEQATFPYELHERISEHSLRKKLQTHSLGVYTSLAESFGLAISDQMYYYPVLLYDGGGYIDRFPSCIPFSTVDQAVEKVHQLQDDKTLWSKACRENERFLQGVSRQAAIEKYTELFVPIDSPPTKTGYKVANMIGSCKGMSYKEVLHWLGWGDYIGAANYSPRWPVTRFDTDEKTYLCVDKEWSPEQAGQEVPEHVVDSNTIFNLF